MPLYHWKSEGEGDNQKSFLEEVDLGHVGKKIEVKPPPSTSVGRTTKLYKCTLCEDVQYKTAGLMARHFNQNHEDKKDSPEAWRKYHEVIHEPQSG